MERVLEVSSRLLTGSRWHRDVSFACLDFIDSSWEGLSFSHTVSTQQGRRIWVSGCLQLGCRKQVFSNLSAAACKHLALKSLHLKNIFMLKLYQAFAIMWTFWHSGEEQYYLWRLSHNYISVNASCFLIQFTDHLLVSWFCLLLTWKIPQILGRFHNLLMKWITSFTWKLV